MDADEKTFNLLILALSTFPGRDEIHKLVKNTYDAPNGKDYEGFYQLEPVPKYLFDEYGLDKILMVETEATTVPKKISRGDGEMIECSEAEYFKKSIADYAENQIDFIECIESGTRADFLSGIINQVMELKKTNNPIRIFVDIHGGPRENQQVLDLLLSLLKKADIPIDSRDIYTVNYMTDKKSHPIEHAGSSYDVMNFVSGIDELVNYGKTLSLEAYRENLSSAELDTLQKMTQISDAITLCDIDLFNQGLSLLRRDEILFGGDVPKDPGYLYTFRELVRNQYKPILDAEDDVRNGWEPDLVKEVDWCMKKQFYQAALTLCESWMTDYLEKNGVIKFSDSAVAMAENKKRKHDKPKNWIFNTFIFGNNNKSGRNPYFLNRYINKTELITFSVMAHGSDHNINSDFWNFVKKHEKVKNTRNIMNHAGDTNQAGEYFHDKQELIQGIKEYLGYVRALLRRTSNNPDAYIYVSTGDEQ